jgi:hypothetical protein
MARRLIEQQHNVTGFDLNKAALAELEAQGGRAASSSAEAAREADCIVLMVVNADQAEAVLFAGGALDALKPGASVILMATCPPARVQAIAAKVQATGRRFIDAPVSGGVVGAEAGTLTIMAAAPKAVFDMARPVLVAMGSRLFHVGEQAGQGAVVKTINQLLEGLPPDPLPMGAIGLLALAVNVYCAFILLPHRKGDSAHQGVWLSTRNDAIANIAIVLAAVITAFWASVWPDVIVGLGIAALNLHAAFLIAILAWQEWQGKAPSG